MNNIEKLNIVEMLFPVENNILSIRLNFQLIDGKTQYRLLGVNDFKDLVNSEKVEIDKKYFYKELFIVDDSGKHYTLFDVTMWHGWCQGRLYVDFAFEGILYDEHFQNNEKLIFEKVELKVNYKTSLNCDYKIDNVYIKISPCPSQEEIDWMEDFAYIATKTMKIELTGNNSLVDYEKILWRLSEFTFLCYEDMLLYNTITLYQGEKQYRYQTYRRSNNNDLNRSNIRTKPKDISVFCSKSFSEHKKTFCNFLEFREKSGIVFDVFRTTIYSKSFREDYPLRLSQTMEGLANYLGIADTSRQDSFQSAIELSLYCNDYIKEYLTTFKEIKSFCKEIKDHRHCFSHAKSNGKYIVGEKNTEYAEILYSTIRVLIIKHLKGEI